MLTAEKIKKCAKAHGADIVGIGSMDRFAGAPAQMDPRYMFPDAKSIIVMGFRHFRGLFRGIEEGTFFTAYSAMGYAGINFIYQPLVLWNVSRLIEDAGYEALPLPNNYMGVYTDITYGGDRPFQSRPVAPDKPAPDVFIQIRLAGFCAGLGEIGYSKMFLSPEFGPRQRLAAILTDAPLTPDPLYEGKLCDRCMACTKACSVQAIPRNKTVKITVAGREIEWADIDMHACAEGFYGTAEASDRVNPFITQKVTPELIGTESGNKNPAMYFYARALEGASGCIRACLIHLEQQGKLKNSFKSEFRKHKPWRLPPLEDDPAKKGLTDFVMRIEVSAFVPADGKLAALSYPADPQALAFKPREFSGAFINLNSEISLHVTDDQALFFRTVLRAEEDMQIQVLLGYDGPIKVWLDKKEVFHDPLGDNPAEPDHAQIPVALKAGRAELLIALGNNRGNAWGIFLRYRRTDLTPARLAGSAAKITLPLADC